MLLGRLRLLVGRRLVRYHIVMAAAALSAACVDLVSAMTLRSVFDLLSSGRGERLGSVVFAFGVALIGLSLMAAGLFYIHRTMVAAVWS